MKRAAAFLLIAIACAGAGWAVYQVATPTAAPLSKYVPAGPMLYLEAKEFSSLLSDWNASGEKKHWTGSASYEVFSQSRLFLRLKAAGDQFAVAGGIPPDMDLLSQVAGDRSALAIYDIGKLQFLYITHLPSSKATQTALWQTRSKFEPRSAGNMTFYIRRDPESEREVAFAIAGEYLLLATREDLMAGALQLIAGGKDRTVESEQWWAQATGAAEKPGELRMVLNLGGIVPDGYFRTYWVQQNITDLSQYSAAVSDLYRSGKIYREERTLIRKTERAVSPSAEDLAATADLVELVPEDAGSYEASAKPAPSACFDLLRTKLLEPHSSAAPAAETAPQVQLTSGEAGGGADLETRIDEATVARTTTKEKSALETLLEKKQIRAALQVQSTSLDKANVFVRTHSAVVLVAESGWNEAEVQSAIASFVRPHLTASELGVGWHARSGYQELNGLWPLLVSVRGNYMLVGDEPGMMEAMLAKVGNKRERPPAEFLAGFNHDRERKNFARFAEVVDRPNEVANPGQDTERVPQFFSGTIASLSESLARVTRESITVRGDKDRVRQTVTYEWSQ
jgi:hypothetical protein